MDKSTPLSHLRRDEAQDEGARQMMEGIVNELQDQDGPVYEEANPEFFQGQPDGPPPPPPPPPSHHPRGPPPPPVRGGNHHPPYPMPGAMPGAMPSGGPQFHRQLENESFFQRIISQAKEPLLVSILVVVLSSSQVNDLLMRFIPIAAGNPLISMLIRAVIAGVVFWLLRRFIPN